VEQWVAGVGWKYTRPLGRQAADDCATVFRKGGLRMKRRPRTDEAGAAFHGSQRQIQLYVNKHSDKLSREVIAAIASIPRDAQMHWVSPLANDHYREYSDEAFLDALGLGAFRRELAAFWPRGGPHWDALAKFDHAGTPGAIMVEAKAHSTEIHNERGTGASPESRKVIEASLQRTCEWLKVPYGPIWTKGLYQSVNRLAHLYFLREVAKVDAWLVNVYFLDDRGYKPTSRDEWRCALVKLKEELGIANVPYSGDVFLQAIEA
jgi:hypothetical protein